MKTAEQSWDALDPHTKVHLWDDGKTAYKAGFDAAMIEVKLLLIEQADKTNPHQHPHGKREAQDREKLL
jgi:hypothetical protein